MAELEAPFRLAFREEGGWVNCYFADRATMNDAILLGSLRLSLASALFDDWKDLMKRGLDIACEQSLGVKPSVHHEEPAPEHERSGKA